MRTSHSKCTPVFAVNIYLNEILGLMFAQMQCSTVVNGLVDSTVRSYSNKKCSRFGLMAVKAVAKN